MQSFALVNGAVDTLTAIRDHSPALRGSGQAFDLPFKDAPIEISQFLRGVGRQLEMDYSIQELFPFGFAFDAFSTDKQVDYS